MESMVSRNILPVAKEALSQFRALCITGPRQSGKTTLSRQLFKDKPYVSFENPEVQAAAENNPQEFLKKYKAGAVFDEVQRSGNIFRYLQEILDNNRQRGQFILTGSNNFLLQQSVSQSLAGRAGYLSLLPFSYAELSSASHDHQSPGSYILRGGYPEIWRENLKADTWLTSYIQTYVQRDVRHIRNITDLSAFNRFILLCANLAGQIINRESLAKQTGVDTKTIQAWLGLLESSYIAYQLQPWHNNLNKRIIKSPKLYFYDTGLLCSLLRIKTISALQMHSAYGAIFENWIITEIRKNRFNNGEHDGMYYFRDSTGNEIDLILEKEERPFAIEIKSAGKISPGMLKNLHYWERYRAGDPRFFIYSGKQHATSTSGINVVPWNDIGNM